MSQRVRIADRFKVQSAEQLVTMAGAVITGLTNNPAFPAPTVDLKAMKAAADDLNAALAAQAHGGEKTRTPTFFTQDCGCPYYFHTIPPHREYLSPGQCIWKAVSVTIRPAQLLVSCEKNWINKKSLTGILKHKYGGVVAD